MADSEEGQLMSYGADGGTQQPPIRPPMPPVPPEGSVPPGGTGGRRVWIGVLIVGGALLFLGLLVVIAFIGADSGSTGGVTSTESNAAEEDLNEDMVSVVSEDSELQLQVPASWEDLKGDLNPAASIEVGDKFDETYAMVISDSREDFADPPSLEEFAQGQLRYFTRRLESPSLSEGINVAEYEQPGHPRAREQQPARAFDRLIPGSPSWETLATPIRGFRPKSGCTGQLA